LSEAIAPNNIPLTQNEIYSKHYSAVSQKFTLTWFCGLQIQSYQSCVAGVSLRQETRW